MGMEYSTVDKKGRILIPKSFRDIFSPGTRVIIVVSPEGDLLVRKVVDADEIIEKTRSIKLKGSEKASCKNAEKGKHMLWRDR